MCSFNKDTIRETHIVKEQAQPIRLQEYGVGIFEALPTKSSLKKAIKKKYIYINTSLATTGTLLNGGETITLHQPSEKQNRRFFSLPLEVIYEDDFLALINKPPGVLVSGNAFKTISNALPQNLIKSSQKDAVAPKPAHRLDFPTSGLLLVGKTASSILALNRLFEHKEISKSYYAITIGVMNIKKDTITSAINGKHAISTYEVLDSLPSENFEYLNLVKLVPLTGRRHQLRKHLASIGNPILGDADYGFEGKILKGKGLYLHAFSLEFTHPKINKKMYFEKELPNKFMKLF
ncbi:RluA family pseudouridine synthase [Aurantibacter sp.]|uniref:RluA family pseudouridine synthase n=1 Tax=Aurantibacter sp. TaxID=2807103 RepID=UPI00326343FC